MRIDIESTGYRPEFMPQKPSGEVNELNNRGENVRGRIIDVNQNIVLVQTSTGKQFSASTTVPLENFIDQEMSFAMLVGPSGEMILVPEIDEKNKREIIDLKIEDMLTKFGKQPTAENKEIIKLMMKAQIPVTKESFEEIKSLKFAMQMLQQDDFAAELEMDDDQKNINDLIKTMQIKKDYNIAKNAGKALVDKNLDIKDIMLLKNIGAKVNIENLKALKSLISQSGEGEIDGLSNIFDKEFMDAIKLQLQNMKEQGNKAENKLNKTFEEFSVEDMEKINKGEKTVIFEDFSDDKNIKAEKDSQINYQDLQRLGISKKEFEILKNEFLSKFPKSLLKLDKDMNLIMEKNTFSEDEIIKEFKNIENMINKNIKEGVKHSKEDILTDYTKLKDEMKILINSFGKESDAAKILEKRLMPKLNMLSDMANKYNYFVVPFKIDENKKNILQYYERKNSKKDKNKDDINIGLCLDTKNMGSVKTMLYYSKNHGLKIDFSIQDENVKRIFDSNMENLKKAMKIIGFQSVDVNTSVKKDMKNNLLDETVFRNDSIKSFEMWI